MHPQDYVEAILGVRPGPGEHRPDRRRHRHEPGSAEAALRAAGAAVAAVDAVMAGEARTAFSAVRPPGHHAEPAVPDGLLPVQQRRGRRAPCAARARRRARRHRRLRRPSRQRHAGDVRRRPDLFYASTHQYPLYPGTGAPRERGVADNIVNVPLPPGAGGAAVPRRLGRAHPARARRASRPSWSSSRPASTPTPRSAGPARGRDRRISPG